LLLQNNRYDDVEQHAVGLIRDWSSSAYVVASAEKLRAQAFLAQKKYPEALSAARSYYDVARFGDSPDAINLLAQCLAVARRDDPRIAKRFKRQQLAWATGNPPGDPTTSQPALQTASQTAPQSESQSASQSSSGSPSDSPNAASLGPPVLATIPPDSKPFEGAAEAIDPLDYHDFASRGNLFLLEGKAAEARDAFERAEGAAADNQEAEAIENVARAIRAQAGCVGPANAYILKMRNQQQQ